MATPSPARIMNYVGDSIFNSFSARQVPPKDTVTVISAHGFSMKG